METSVGFYETIARFYDAENATMVEDLPLYTELVEEYPGTVLDVGCGTGRVMLHLARHGAQVVGVDNSPAMLARGRRKLTDLPDLAERVRFVEGDAREVELPGPFSLILVPYNGLLHFNALDDQRAVLRHLRRHAAGDALLALDLPNAGEAFGTQDDGAVALERMFTEPETGHLVMQQSLSTLARVDQQLHIIWIYDEIMDDAAVHRVLAPLDLRYVFPGEIELLLSVTGWQQVEVYGDYDQSPFEEGSPRMIVLAEAAPEPRV